MLKLLPSLRFVITVAAVAATSGMAMHDVSKMPIRLGHYAHSAIIGSNHSAGLGARRQKGVMRHMRDVTHKGNAKKPERSTNKVAEQNEISTQLNVTSPTREGNSLNAAKATPWYPHEVTPWTSHDPEKLCSKFGWRKLRVDGPEADAQPRIFYGLLASGQANILELHLDEIYPLAHRISMIEVTHYNDGTKKDDLLNFSSPQFARFSPKLRARTVDYKLELEEMARKKQLSDDLSWGFATEMTQRLLLSHGMKTDGQWDIRPGDVVFVSDGDEIPTRELMQALTDCVPPHFDSARAEIKQQKSPCKEKGRPVKVMARTQTYQSFFDCPTEHMLWHPDAIMAECLLSGDWSLEDVRMRDGGVMTQFYTGRHIHNFFTVDDLVKKYAHYAEKCLDDSCHEMSRNRSAWPELHWRACDPQAPPLSSDGWWTRQRPLLEFWLGSTGREHHVPPGLEFEMVQMYPNRFVEHLWKGHEELKNAWAGKNIGKGPHTYTTG